MPFTDQTPVAVGDPTRASHINTLIANAAFLNSALTDGAAPGQVPNGSFENLAGEDPANWTFTPYSGGDGAIDNTTAISGINSFKITGPGGGGNGGGYLETTDFIAWPNQKDIHIEFGIKADDPTAKNSVVVLFYDDSQSLISSFIAWYEDAANPASWALVSATVLNVFIPDDTRYIKVRLIGAEDTSPTCNVWFDAVKFTDKAGEKFWDVVDSTATLNQAAGAGGSISNNTNSAGERTTLTTPVDNTQSSLFSSTKKSRKRWDSYLDAVIEADNDDNWIVFVGLIDAVPSSFGSPITGRSGFGIYFNDSESNNWKFVVNDGGGTATAVDTGIDFDTNKHRVQVAINDRNGIVGVRIGTGPAFQISTDLPGQDTTLGACVLHRNISGASADHDFHVYKLNSYSLHTARNKVYN